MRLTDFSGLSEEELGLEDERPDPYDPRSRVDPDMASPEEVVGMTRGPDPLRMRREDEKLTLCDACSSDGMGYF